MAHRTCELSIDPIAESCRHHFLNIFWSVIGIGSSILVRSECGLDEKTSGFLGGWMTAGRLVKNGNCPRVWHADGISRPRRYGQNDGFRRFHICCIRYRIDRDECLTLACRKCHRRAGSGFLIVDIYRCGSA